jgi:outer membrane protein TolC
MKEEIEKALLEAQEQLKLAQEEEERTEEAMDSMERKYWEGQIEALVWVLNKLEEASK